MRALFLGLASYCFCGFVLSPATGRLLADEANDFFERKIRPVLVQHCYACHSTEGRQVEGGLRLDSRDAMRRGGESGPAVLPEKADESLLISAIKYESLEMPPKEKLSEQTIRDFEKWVALGAPDPREEQTLPLEEVKSAIDFNQGRQFWSFQKPTLPDLPIDPFGHWAQNRIDHFVAAEMKQHELLPAARADSSVLFRRLAFDLIGLPPTTEQLAKWAALPEETAIEQITQELLASSAFGEHWARLWLDIMRYADDQAHIVGNDQSLFFPNSYLYRDWVINSFNTDLPYDRFVELQLAADIVTPTDLADDVALGFVGLGPKYYRRNAPEVQAEEWEDRVDVLSRGLLGLTVACARCHDHKYDPIGTADYYALAGVFASTEMFNRPLDDKRELNDKGHAKSPTDAMHVIRDAAPRDLSIMVRGDVNRLGPVVPRGFLTVLAEDKRSEFQQGSGRLELARQIVSKDNPLTARVFVNRVWARIVGHPLVSTPSNFGKLGERPTHPELLDDLAMGFMENGWSLKWLCREIVSSATYQQASLAQVGTADPQNRWLSHMNRKRLSVEQWRDAVLSASGRLQKKDADTSKMDPSDPASQLRTIYSESSRLKLNPMLSLFDYPDPNTHSDARSQTVSATQKLFMMNSPFMVNNAAVLAEKIQAQRLSIRQSIDEIYWAVLSREPTQAELSVAMDYLTVDGSNFHEYIHAVLMSNEAFLLD